MDLINPNRAKAEIILPNPKQFTAITLTNSWQELHPGYLINVQDTTSIGIWLDMIAVSGFEIRVLATYDRFSTDFFQLPIKSPTSNVVNLDYEQFSFPTATGNVKFVFAIPTADVLHYLKIEIKGTGTVQKAFVSAKGRL